MLKIFLIVLSLLFIKTPETNKKELFDMQVEAAYEKYASYYQYSNDNFSLEVIRGIVNEKTAYGVLFSNAFAKTYSIDITDSKGVKYKLPTDERGDLFVVAFEEILNEEYTISIYKGNELVSLPTTIKLLPFTESELDASPITSIYFGQNKGVTTQLFVKKAVLNSEMIYIIIGLGSIVLGCVIIILAFAKMKKGMFDKAKREDGVFKFKDFLSQDFKEQPKSEFDIIDLNNNEVLKDEKEEMSDDKEQEIYEKNIRYDTDEKSGFPLSEYLIEKGYTVDYKTASEEEKQKIMLELMKLKNDKKITEDEYLEEAYKLWKE